jgi:short-subunit dehydrogenase
MFSLCLVTGATGGIGRAIALELARRGAALVVSGRDGDALAALAAETGARAVRADLTDRADVERLAAEAGEVDVVVHAAGAGQYGQAVELSPADVERLVALNVTAPVLLTAALLPGMVERRRGHVVFVGSIAGRVGRAREALYAATKAGISVFGDSLQAELRGSGVSVLVVTPGPVATRFFERRGVPYDRRWPRPIAAGRVARATVDALEAGRAEVTVPAWLSLPARLRGAAPGLFRALAGRFD